MTPWLLLDTAHIPGQHGAASALRLYQRGEEFSIKAGNSELMNSRVHGSEDALAELACGRIAGRARPRVLIGGLGMGYTLAAALQQLRDDAEVVVAELVPAVVAWNRGALAHLAGHPLSDARVTVRCGRTCQSAGVQELQRGHGPLDLAGAAGGELPETVSREQWA